MFLLLKITTLLPSIFSLSFILASTKAHHSSRADSSHTPLNSYSDNTDQRQALLSAASSYTIRPAVLNDLDDVTTVLSSAFAGTPAWDYGYQYRQECPQYHWYCLRVELEQQFEHMHPGTTWVRVIEDHETGHVVSVAIWRDLNQNSAAYWDPPVNKYDQPSVPRLEDKGPGSIDCSLRLDQNVTRINDFTTHLAYLRRPYIEDAYLRQFHLEQLATHPHFQGRGYAADLVRWGVEKARNEGVNVVTVVSTEGAEDFYRSVGFIDLGNLNVRRLDGQKDLKFEAMRWA